MMRTYPWIAVAALCLFVPHVAAQGMYYPPAPYPNPGYYGYPPQNNAPVAQMGIPAGNPGPGRPDDMIQRLTYINTMQVMSGGGDGPNMNFGKLLTLTQATSPAPAGPPTSLPPASNAPPAGYNAGPPMPAPGSAYCDAALAPACATNCANDGALPPDPQKPLPAERPLLNPTTPSAGHGNFLSTLLYLGSRPCLDNIYDSWLLNLLWRANCEPWPDPGYHSWARFEYLGWKISNAPVPIPLVTGNTNPAAIGAIGEAGTTVLYGAGSDQSTYYGLFAGARLSLGGWCSQCPIGMEVNAFGLEQRAQFFNVSSAGGNSPIVSIPFNATQPFDIVNPAGETALNAGGAPNAIHVTQTSRLWGAEINGLIDLLPADYAGPIRCNFIAGVRYLDLEESLTLADVFFDSVTASTLTTTDAFRTRNQFIGPQFGMQSSVAVGRWTLDLTGKIGLGAMRQNLDIAGSTAVINGAFGFTSGTSPGAVFAQPSNIGQFSRNVFAIVPEGTFKLYYDLTPSIRPFVGYNVLYMSSVLRPGNQLDRNINPTQSPFFSVPGGVTTGPLVPLPVFKASDFWAQGFNVGLELRF